MVCIAPDKIEKVMKELFRVAKKAVIFNEWHSDDIKSPLYNDHWIYNYNFLLNKFSIPKNKTKITKIPAEIWPGDWAKYGYIVEISLN